MENTIQEGFKCHKQQNLNPSGNSVEGLPENYINNNFLKETNF